MPGPLGVSNAEFNRHIEYMSAEFLGGPALVNYLLQDLGPLDEAGRPQAPCTLWWFLAHLDPTSTKITAQREQLTTFIKRGALGRDDVQRFAFALIGDARAHLGDATAAARVNEFGTETERQSYPAGRAALTTLLAAAEDAVRAWVSDPSFRGNSYFVARTMGGGEFVSTRSARTLDARKYSTDEDEQVAMWPRETVLAFGGLRRATPSPALPTSMPVSRPSPALAPTAAPSRLSQMPQADAVKALLAANVLEMAGAGALSQEFVTELHADAVDAVAERAGANDRQKKLLRHGTAGFGDALRDKDAHTARAEAQAILSQLGVGLGDVRTFRNRLADSLTGAINGAAPLPSSPGTTKAHYKERVAELVSLADAIERAGRVTMDDVETLRRFVDGVDLETIYDVAPSLQELFQNQIFYVWKTIGPPDPEFHALEAIYRHALSEAQRLKAERAQSTGHLAYEPVRDAIVAILKATSFEQLPSDATYDQVAALSQKLTPDAKASEVEHIAGCAASIGAFAWQANPALHQRFLALSQQIRERTHA